jgi:hypothetical protein
MKEEIRMSLNPTAELRPDSHEFALKPARISLNLSNRRLGKSKAAEDSPSALPHAFDGRMLAMQRAPNGKCRLGPCLLPVMAEFWPSLHSL